MCTRLKHIKLDMIFMGNLDLYWHRVFWSNFMTLVTKILDFEINSLLANAGRGMPPALWKRLLLGVLNILDPTLDHSAKVASHPIPLKYQPHDMQFLQNAWLNPKFLKKHAKCVYVFGNYTLNILQSYPPILLFLYIKVNYDLVLSVRHKWRPIFCCLGLTTIYVSLCDKQVLYFT